MNRRLIWIGGLVVLAVGAGGYLALFRSDDAAELGTRIAVPQIEAVVVGAADSRTQSIVDAAQNYLSTLTQEQRGTSVFEYSDEESKFDWSNLPYTAVERNGVSLSELSVDQTNAFFAVLSELLSEYGYQSIIDQLAADEALATDGTPFGDEYYAVAFFGEPSLTAPWMLQFGGHHLALNATVVGERITLAPTLTGGQPLIFEQEGKAFDIRATERLAFESLAQSVGARALAEGSRSMLILGPGIEGYTLEPSGLSAADMDNAERAQLLTLIGSRINFLNSDDAEVRMAEIRNDLDRTYFAIYGDLNSLDEVYWRVVGPSIVMEYSPETLGGDLSQHAHSVLREPGNDYGAAWTLE